MSFPSASELASKARQAVAQRTIVRIPTSCTEDQRGALWSHAKASVRGIDCTVGVEPTQGRSTLSVVFGQQPKSDFG